ncbi:SET domain-containing protein 5 [Madurella fahalii]|uniref:SET domain-containing protein 5 n=1 Tax=Madurella fahalii TaxID=1157608 RepID=A0ABQ0FYY0_9PEZI
MHSRPFLSVLSAATIAAALQTQLTNTEICPSNPLFRTDQLICAAPRPKAKTVAPAFIKVEPELWENDERFKRPSDYKVPPSWEGPENCFADFCVYSTKEKGDSGMVLITTARNAYLAANFPNLPRSSIEPTAYYEAEVPGKGIGLIANRTIRKGEIIFQHLPSLLIQSTPHLDLEAEVRENLYQSALDKLPEAAREKFLRQMGDTVYRKVEKNSFRIFMDGKRKYSAHLGIYPDVSRFNHDCRPNVHYRLANITHTTVAVRDIQPGEELTISYIYGQAVKSERQTQLKAWGFDCSCSQCTLSSLESAASDARIRQIKELEEEIEQKMSKDRGAGVRPEMGGKLVELYLAERLDAYLAPAYTRAALIYSMFGNEEKAREYAAEAVEALEREYGSHATDIESMRKLAENPKSHWSWGVMATSGKGEKKNQTKAEGKRE